MNFNNISYDNNNYGLSFIPNNQRSQIGSISDTKFKILCVDNPQFPVACYYAWEKHNGNSHDNARNERDHLYGNFNNTFTFEEYDLFKKFHEEYVKQNMPSYGSQPNNFDFEYNQPPNLNNQNIPVNLEYPSNASPLNNQNPFSSFYLERSLDVNSVLKFHDNSYYWPGTLNEDKNEIHVRIGTINNFKLVLRSQRLAPNVFEHSNLDSNKESENCEININYAPMKYNIGSYNHINSNNRTDNNYGDYGDNNSKKEDGKKKKQGWLGWTLVAVAGVVAWFAWKEQKNNRGGAEEALKGICMKERDIRDLVNKADFLDNVKLEDRVVELLRGPQEIVDHAESVLLQRLVYKVATIAGLVLGAIGGIFAVEAALSFGVIFAAIGAVVWIVDALSRDGYETIVIKAFMKLQEDAAALTKTKWQYDDNNTRWVELNPTYN